jgi:asparagine synthetase B (glutamine-hydrolysing)
LFAAMRQLGARRVLSGSFGDQMLADTSYLFDLVGRFRWVKAVRISAVLAERMGCDARLLRRKLWTDLLRTFVPEALLPAWRSMRFRRDTNRYPIWYSGAFRRRALARAQSQSRLTRHGASRHSLACYHHAQAHLNLIEEQNKAAALFGLELAYPFMDRDLIAFLMAIPGEVVNWQGVPKGLYRAAMQGILPEVIRLRGSKADFTYFVNEASADSCAEMAGYLDADCLAARRGYVDLEVARRELDRARPLLLQGYDGDPTRRMTRLIGLEMWLRVFFGERLAGEPAHHAPEVSEVLFTPVGA